MNVDLASKLAGVCERNQVPYTINLTNISCYDSDWIQSCFSKLPDSAIVVYIADSRGNLTPDRIPAIYEALRSVRDAVFGFHAHDNLGLAVRNSEAALQFGATWLDGSVLGIGLGGRNLDILDAAHLAGKGRSDLPGMTCDQGVSESDFGVPPRGPEMELFRITGESNFKMEWAVMMARVLGQDEACSIIKSLPSRPMFQPEELRPFLKEETWGRLTW
jgi:4-hydroxy 2-oxovalerate aldolase